MQTKDLRDQLTYKVSSEADLQAIVDSFIALRNDRISTNPRRKGWDEAGKSDNILPPGTGTSGTSMRS